MKALKPSDRLGDNGPPHARLLTAHPAHRLVFYDAEGKTGGIAARAFDHGRYIIIRWSTQTDCLKCTSF